MATERRILRESIATLYQINHSQNFSLLPTLKVRYLKEQSIELESRIKRCAKLVPQETIVKMFDKLKDKAARDGLESLFDENCHLK